MKKIETEGETQNLLFAKTYFTEKEVARRLCMSEKWLQKMRHRGGGIPYYKIGNAIRYGAPDIVKFEASCKRGSTSDTGDITSDTEDV